MPVEIGWVEKHEGEFVVRRATYHEAGQVIRLNTVEGQIVLVLTSMGGTHRLTDAEVCICVADEISSRSSVYDN